MTEFRKTLVRQGGSTLSGRYYTSEEIFREEVERIFSRQWLSLGRVEQIPDPGDYVVTQVVYESLLVVRDRSGVLRTFFNVCRHRGARLCMRECGHLSETIQCPYHAWTYTLDGRLLAARNMQDVDGFDRSDYPLYGVGLAEWEGFLFVNLAPEPEPFAAAFAPLIGKFSVWHLPELRAVRRIEYNVQANWKQIVENYLECYHCPLIHPELCWLSPPTSGRNDLSEGPFLGGYMMLNSPGGSLTTTGRTPRPPLGEVAGEDRNRVYYYAIFPNLLLSLHPDYVMVHLFWPQGARCTRIICEWLFDPAAIAEPGFDPSDAVEFWDRTNRQDWYACELAQLGVRSRAYTPGPYAHAEELLDAFDREYLRRMGEA
jgi:Rieske 2Fe-2S family protein